MGELQEVESRMGSGLPMVLSVLPRLAAIGAIGISVAGISLHLCGYVAQSSYLRSFGLDPDGFPRSADWLTFNGYYTAMDRASWVLSNMSWWLFLGVVFYLALLILTVRWEPSKRYPPRWLRRLNPHPMLKLGASSISYAFFGVSSVYIALVLAVLILIVPGLAGETAGRKKADEDLRLYLAGCDERRPCSEVWRGEFKLVEGFVLATSATHIAMFDPALGASKIVERTGTSLVARLDPRRIEDAKRSVAID